MPRNSDLSNISLDLDTYELEDILKLFSLEEVGTINQEDMKSARKTVMMTHPDKSGLSKEFFQFFAKAYERLSTVVDFRDRTSQTQNSYMDKHRRIDVDIENESNFAEALKKSHIVNDNYTVGKKWTDWKQKFDEWFEQHGELSANIEGYDEFMKSTEDLLPEGATQEEAKAFIETRKATLGALINHETISSIDSWNTFGGKSGCCGRFGVLQGGGEDLRKAYTETVVPVTEDTFKNRKQYSSMDEFKRARHQETNMIDYESGKSEYYRNKVNEEKRDLDNYYREIQKFEQNRLDVEKFRRSVLQISR